MDDDDFFDLMMLGKIIPTGGCLICLVIMIGIPISAAVLIL